MLRKKKPKRDSGTRSRVSKKPWACKAYRDHVKSLPCIVCAVPAVDAHHIRETFARTMGRRISDIWVVPLCRAHHTDLHNHSRTFWSDVLMDPQIACAAMFKQWERRRPIEAFATRAPAVRSEAKPHIPLSQTVRKT